MFFYVSSCNISKVKSFLYCFFIFLYIICFICFLLTSKSTLRFPLPNLCCDFIINLLFSMNSVWFSLRLHQVFFLSLLLFQTDLLLRHILILKFKLSFYYWHFCVFLFFCFCHYHQSNSYMNYVSMWKTLSFFSPNLSFINPISFFIFSFR